MKIEIPGHIDQVLTEPLAQLRTTLDPATRQTAIEQACAPLRVMWAHDAEQRGKAEQHAIRDVDATLAARAGELAYTVQQLTTNAEQFLTRHLAAEEAAPSPALAWLQKERRVATGMERVQLEGVAEQYRSRFDRELSTASAEEILESYERAWTDPDDQFNAAVIRWVEANRGGPRWTGPALRESTDQAVLVFSTATKRLRELIATAKQNRRQPSTRAALDTVTAANALVGQARGARVGDARVELRVTNAWKERIA